MSTFASQVTIAVRGDHLSASQAVRECVESDPRFYVLTKGVHLADQPPFDTDAAAGDPTWRSIPVDTAVTDLLLSHGGYDTRRASADPNVVLPLEHLRALRDRGEIGSLAPNVYSFMGYIAETNRLLNEEGAAIAERLLADQADLVLLAPT